MSCGHVGGFCSLMEEGGFHFDSAVPSDKQGLLHILCHTSHLVTTTFLFLLI